MGNGLEKIVAGIEDKGLPSVEEMRAVLKQQEEQERVQALQAKLTEYKNLFDRFKASNDLTNEEMKRMGDLSGELQKLSEAVQ